MGINWVGPAIMRFGTPQQQAQHLPAIAAGDVIWCQGFSEPDAGSDLASLSTRAVPDGSGGWRITGQKVWTSYALMAQWCILAARTSVEAAKHEGITMFLVPMESQGITVRPIPNLLGPHHLNEVFLDDVSVGPDDVLGPVDGGWSVIREALKFERIGIARYARCDRLLTLLARRSASTGPSSRGTAGPLDSGARPHPGGDGPRLSGRRRAGPGRCGRRRRQRRPGRGHALRSGGGRSAARGTGGPGG